MTDDGPRWHIECLVLTEDAPEQGYTNFVDVAQDDVELRVKLSEMIGGLAPADRYGIKMPCTTYALHVRRLPQPDGTGEDLYRETQPLARAQADAHRYRSAFEALGKRYRELERAKGKADEGADREVAILERKLGKQAEQIERQAIRLDRIRLRAERDLRCCVTMEPEEILPIVSGHKDTELAIEAETLRQKLLDMLPTEPLPEKFGSDNQYKAALAEWGVYEQIAKALGVTLPLAAVEGRLADDQ